jgi:hypothetical protein
LEGHEVWQFANQRANNLGTSRLSSDASKENPVIALSKETHQEVSAAQRSMDASKQTPAQNIRANAEILRRTNAAPESAIQKIERMAIELATKLGF